MRTRKSIRYSTLWNWSDEGKVCQYKAPLIVVSAGILGLLLLCGVSALALQSPQQPFQEKVDPADLIYREQDSLAMPNARTKVECPAEKIWLPWLNINVDAPFLLDGRVCAIHSTRAHRSDFDKQGIISREENK
jgi:hypothetical protein